MTYIPGKVPQVRDTDSIAIAQYLERELRILAGSLNLKLEAPRGHIDGYQMVWASNTTLTIGAGIATDDQNLTLITSTATITLNFGTTGINALDVGTIAASTWYYIFIIISVTGNVATLASTSLSPTMPSGYKYKRRIGAWYVNASVHLETIYQNVDTFLWGVQKLDVTNVAISTPLVNYTISVPLLPVDVLGHVLFSNSVAAATVCYVEQPSTIVTAQDERARCPVAGVHGSNDVVVHTTTQQITAWSTTAANNSFYWETRGWIDYRGKNL